MKVEIILVLLLMFIEIPAAFGLGYYFGKAVGAGERIAEEKET